MIEMIVIALVLLFMIVYRKSNGDIRKYISENSGEATNKYKKYNIYNSININYDICITCKFCNVL